MNEVLLSRAARFDFNRRLLRRVAWKVVSSVALGGLYVWDLEDHCVLIAQKDMPLKGLGKGFDGSTLAHVSDLHLSPIVRERYLRKFVEAVNAMEVDFVAVTGDLVTGSMSYARRVARLVRQFRPGIATLVCLGNHDYGMWHPNGLGGVRGLAEYLSEHLLDAGVGLMNNRSHIFRRDGAVLQFVGVEDLWSDRYDPAAAFRRVDTSRPVVALVHNPDAAPQLASLGAQWVLAGHTHGRDRTKRRFRRFRKAVFPACCRHFVAGQYPLGGRGFLYVNRGIGHSRRRGPNHRPEITLFTLRAC